MAAPVPALDTASALRSQAAALRAQANTLDALADSLAKQPASRDDLLNVDRALSEFGIGRDGLKAAAARGELSLSRGARGKILVARAELTRWLADRPYKATRKAEPLPDVDALDLELARGGLVRAA
jgi:hypothetical protein